MFWSEKKTCFVQGDGEILYPGEDREAGPPGDRPSTGACAAGSSSAEAEDRNRLKSPPPPSDGGGSVQGWGTSGSLPQALPTWRVEHRDEATALSDDCSAEDGGATSGEGLSISRAASLRSFGRSPTPDILHPLRKRCRDDLSITATDSEHDDRDAPAAQPAKRRRKAGGVSSASRSRLRSHFLRLPMEVLTPIIACSALEDVIALQQTCVALRRMTPTCLEVLDLSACTWNRYLSILVMRLSMAGMTLKGISVSANLNERFLGIIGFVLKSSPRLRTIEMRGCPSTDTVQAMAEQCPNLKEYLQVGGLDADPGAGHLPAGTHVIPPGLQSLGLILDGGKKHLSSITLGQTTTHELLKPPYLGVAHAGLRRLRLDGLSSGAFPAGTRCSLPALTCLSIFEGPVCPRCPPIAVADIMCVVWDSPHLFDLTVAASFQWTQAEVQTLSTRCPGIEKLRLKSGAQGTERWYADAPTEQITGGVFNTFLATFKLRELHIEAAGWDPHWTAYHDIVNADSLVLQTQLAGLEQPLSHHLQHHATFRHLQNVVLYGDVTNHMVRQVLRWCDDLRRLEVYLLPPSYADDALLTVDEPGFVKPSLTHLHIHDATAGRGLGKSLSEGVLDGLGGRFPGISRLGLVGLPTELVIKRLTAQEMPHNFMHLAHLTLGPFLKTSAELLLLLKAAPGLTQLHLAWNGGQLPRGDEEFPALGLCTLTKVAQLVNPRLGVTDVQGHFNILF